MRKKPPIPPVMIKMSLWNFYIIDEVKNRQK